MSTHPDFANYCCELLSGAGPCVARRMFGGFGVSTGGLTIAILADLDGGERLWLKGDKATHGMYAAAGCKTFSYTAKGVQRSMNYFSAPDEAMDSADAMRPWARLALECALRARAAKPLFKDGATAKRPKRMQSESRLQVVAYSNDFEHLLRSGNLAL